MLLDPGMSARDSSGDEEAPLSSSSGTGTGFSGVRQRNPNFAGPRAAVSGSDQSRRAAARREHHNRSVIRRLQMCLPCRGRLSLYFFPLVIILGFALATIVLQSFNSPIVFRQRSNDTKELMCGFPLKFEPRTNHEKFKTQLVLDRLRRQAGSGYRSPRLALVLGNMKKDASALMLATVIMNLQKLGYIFKIYAVEDGQARLLWEKIGGHISIFGSEIHGHVYWLNFEGVIVDSLEAKEAVLSLMMEPYCSLPLIWIIQEDILANRLPEYEDLGWNNLISHWKDTFSRADAIVFPDFSLPMLHSVLDSGNFIVIPGTPIDVWTAESYSKAHSKIQLRKVYGFGTDDMMVVILGSSFSYNEISLEYAVAMHDIGPLLVKYAGVKDITESFKFLFLCGKSTDKYDDALQDIATHLGLNRGSLEHYGFDSDVNGLLVMSDIVLYASSQDEQGFPPLLTRAMSFGIPVIAPDYPVIKKYVHDDVDGIIFPKHRPDALVEAFSRSITDGKLSPFAHSAGKAGKVHARNLFASECITGYAQLLEFVLSFPSASKLPNHISHPNKVTWGWHLFLNETEGETGDFIRSGLENTSMRSSNIVYALEKEMDDLKNSMMISQDSFRTVEKDFPTQLDWDILREMERSEETEQLEMEELEERMEKDVGVWDEIYRNARKAEKLKFETNERDEGELERFGLILCIYDVYGGAGEWPFLHHGSVYRGLSLSRREQRLGSDDVDAVSRLPLLNDTYYRDILCDMGGMFSIANEVDNVHKCPWIGFHSSRAAAGKVSLSTEAGQALEERMRTEDYGDVIYFWAFLGLDDGASGSHESFSFWSMCDTLNGGNCREMFEEAFRRMYALPSHVEALPPMPEDGGHWSAMHSWVMPTSSFLEFVMFSRMFVDSLDGLHMNSGRTSDCKLGASMPEKQHCYCRILELLVNVWAYHSGRKMIYIHPHTGTLQEQHLIEQRKGLMWAKYFNDSLLKSMDEDLAEAADDGEYPHENWLWPLTGEVYWKGVYDREREERFRLKVDKKRGMKEKLHDRMKHGYKQKTLG